MNEGTQQQPEISITQPVTDQTTPATKDAMENNQSKNKMGMVVIFMLLLVIVFLGVAVVYLLTKDGEEVSNDDNDVEPTVEVTIEPTEEVVEPTETTVVPTEDTRGTITGSISGPPTDAPGEHQFIVCAENVDTGSTSCTEEITILPSNYIVDYELKLAPGSYEVYSYDVAAPDWLVYYSEMVTCGFEAGCPDDIIIVDVVSGETLVDIDPTDFYTVR